MPFSPEVAKRAITRLGYCEVCGLPLCEGEVCHAHSATGLHLERPAPDQPWTVHHFLESGSTLHRKLLPPHAFPELDERNDDAFGCHRNCHEELHRIARVEGRLFIGVSGHTVPPADLLYITLQIRKDALKNNIKFKETERTLYGPDEGEVVVSEAPCKIARTIKFTRGWR